MTLVLLIDKTIEEGGGALMSPDCALAETHKLSGGYGTNGRRQQTILGRAGLSDADVLHSRIFPWRLGAHGHTSRRI